MSHLHAIRERRCGTPSLLALALGLWCYMDVTRNCGQNNGVFCCVLSLQEEARALVESGVVELNLIAEDTNQYGQDR